MGEGILLLGCPLQPLDALGVVRLHAVAHHVAAPEHALGVGIAGFGFGGQFGDVCCAVGCY